MISEPQKEELQAKARNVLNELSRIREILKIEEDSSDYYRISLIIERFEGFISRRNL